jgi:hypothetical protein
LGEAAKIGPATVALFAAIMKAKPHPERGFRSCLGILSLMKSYGPERIGAAARRGNDIGATTFSAAKEPATSLGLNSAPARSVAGIRDDIYQLVSQLKHIEEANGPSKQEIAEAKRYAGESRLTHELGSLRCGRLQASARGRPQNHAIAASTRRVRTGLLHFRAGPGVSETEIGKTEPETGA